MNKQCKRCQTVASDTAVWHFLLRIFGGFRASHVSEGQWLVSPPILSSALGLTIRLLGGEARFCWWSFFFVWPKRCLKFSLSNTKTLHQNIDLQEMVCFSNWLVGFLFLNYLNYLKPAVVQTCQTHKQKTSIKCFFPAKSTRTKQQDGGYKMNNTRPSPWPVIHAKPLTGTGAR